MNKPTLPVEEEVFFDTAGLYPELSEEEQREAAYFLGRYLDVVCRIYERIRLTENE